MKPRFLENKFTYYSCFSSEIIPLEIEKEKLQLAKASVEELAGHIPEVDDKNVDLLPIAFNAFVANMVNKNDDVVDSATAISLAESMPFKQMNIEHNRKKVIGVIIHAGYSEFGTNKTLTKEQVKDMDEPFNVVLGAFIWRVVDEDVAGVIEASANPDSDLYMKISASWEVGFSDFDIVLIEGESKDLKDGRVVPKSDELSASLKDNEGSGVLSDGTRVYRKPTLNSSVGLGIGLTENPAAAVEGLAANVEEPESVEVKASNIKETVRNALEELLKENDEEKSQKISQAKKINVNRNRKVMKITSLRDITEESLKEMSASTIRDFVEDSLKEANDKFVAEQAAKETAATATTELQVKHDALEAKIAEVQAKLSELETEKEAQATQDKFSQRMASFDEKFELADEDRQAIASQIKGVTDEAYEAYAIQMDVLLASKDKAKLAEIATSVKEAADKEAAEKENKETTASEKKEEPSEEEKTEAVDTAVANAEDTDAGVPSTPSEDKSLKQKYEAAFAEDQFDIK